MKRKVISTSDGSKTIYIPEWNESYHSKHGAIQEANHVFLNMGLQHLINSKNFAEVNILEIGFGTGLNAFLTALEAQQQKIKVHYTGIEAYPVSEEELAVLNYPKKPEQEKLFDKLHSIPWEVDFNILPFFRLKKCKKHIQEIEYKAVFNLIYFDAFGARVQPELWTEQVFETMFNALEENGILVTYAAKGSVRRAMQAVGFSVEKLPGPPGKREMLRASKFKTKTS